MQACGMTLCLSSPTTLLYPKHKTCYPVSVEIPSVSRLSSSISCKRSGKTKLDVETQRELEPLWDDGYGTQTVRDYIEAARSMTKPDGGPPRWFCPVECGPPLRNSPLLLYLPGIDGVGMGMVLHHKAMGKVFHVRCMHIPVRDRTPYKGLVKFVEKAVKDEHASFPDKPIYLVADSFGACLALSVAAANPTIDLVLILVNPATSFNRSQLQPLLPFLELLPEQYLPCIYGIAAGDPIMMANVITATKPFVAPTKHIENFFGEISSLAAGVSNLAGILPKQAIAWKLKLLKTGSASANLCLHAVKSEVLILAGGKDSMLPSDDEARRLLQMLENSRVRFFNDNGHLLLMEDGINLLTIIKGTHIYRRSKKRDPFTDFLPPSKSEYHRQFNHEMGFLRLIINPLMLSTLPDGKVVRGLQGIPEQGPVLLVGYHMLLGIEISSIVEEFLRDRNLMIHGLAHPWVFDKRSDYRMMNDTTIFDKLKLFGAIPVNAKNLSRLLSAKSYVLLYPGGLREVLHRKGESHKLFWPEKPEFVRTAAKYGATIVPFGAVGDDDVMEYLLDYNDQMRIPALKELIEQFKEIIPNVRAGVDATEQVGEQTVHVPIACPKLPGRLYFLFGRPMETAAWAGEERDEMKMMELYKRVKREVERCMDYLIEKREEDPCRNIFDRLLYRAFFAPLHDVATFPL